MACRDALEASGGDYEKAKTAVMSKLKNRDGKVMAEGLVALYADADSVGCVEIACETDFVARGASMARLSASAASVAAGSPSVGEELLARVREAVKAEMTEAAKLQVQKEWLLFALFHLYMLSGERLDVRRAWRTSLRPALFAGSYLHAPSGQVFELRKFVVFFF
jgi:translation elongation factor EF-Ts